MTNMTSTAYPSIFADTMKRDFGVEFDMPFPLCPSRYVVWGLVFYVSSIIFFQPDKPKKSPENSSATVATSSTSSQTPAVRKKKPFGVIEGVIFVHNLVLAIFSLLCFVNTAPIMFNFFSTYGYGGTICRSQELYDPEVSSFHMWTYLFYLSKYWYALP